MLKLEVVKRVKWFRARASLMRWMEEVEILETEFRRTIASCKTMESFWNEVAEKVPPDSKLKKSLISSDSGVRNSGYTSYAWQKAAMYERMAAKLSGVARGCGCVSPTEGETTWDCLERRRPKFDVDWEAEAVAPDKTDELEREIWEVYGQTEGGAIDDPIV